MLHTNEELDFDSKEHFKQFAFKFFWVNIILNYIPQNKDSRLLMSIKIKFLMLMNLKEIEKVAKLKEKNSLLFLALCCNLDVI